MRNIWRRIPRFGRFRKRARDFTEDDKAVLLDKQHELLAAVLPEYRQAARAARSRFPRRPITIRFFRCFATPISPRISNPHTPLPNPAFRYPEDAREQLVRARAFHERVFGKPPAGLWPSEGSVSDQALEIAMELGFKWFATDEGVLGRTQNIGFWRDAGGYPGKRPSTLHTLAAEARHKRDERVFPRPLSVGPGRIRLQPDGSGGRGRGFAPQNSRDWRPRSRRARRRR